MPATAPLHSFPAGFFTEGFDRWSTDQLAQAASWCDDNAVLAAPASRAKTLWCNRREQVIAAIGARGLSAVKVDRHSPFIAVTADEYTRIVNSPHRNAGI